METINKAFAEVSVILNLLGEDYKNKIPKKFLDYIESQRDNDYKVIIDPEEPLENQYLLEDTINILALLKLDYWCNNEEEKVEFIKRLNDNDKKRQKELYEKYNPDNIFNNIKTYSDNQNMDNEETTAMVEIKKENIIKKIFDKIKKFFIRK